MAIVTVPTFVWPYTDVQRTINTAALSLAGATQRVAFLVEAPKSGTINSVAFRTNTVTTGDTIRVSFQDVDLTTGNPDGTVDQFRAHVVNSTDDNVVLTTGLITSDGTDLGSKRTVTRGDWFFVVFDFSTYVAGNMQFQTNQFIVAMAQNNCATFNGTTWTKSSNAGAVMLIYDDSSSAFAITNQLVSNASSGTFASNSTPDERAAKFRLPISVQVGGVSLELDHDANADIVLYDSNGTTALGTITLDSDVRNTTSVARVSRFFSSPITLLANTFYYLAIKPTTTTAIGWREQTLASSAHLASTAGGADYFVSTRTDAGAWTDDQTRQPAISLLISGIDTGGGSGGVPLIGPGGLVY